MTGFITIAIIFTCILVAGFFAGMETGLVTADSMLQREKKRKALLYIRAYHYLLAKPDRLLGTTLIGYNICSVTAAVLLTNYMDRLGLVKFAWLAILLLTFVVLVASDIIPKSFFRRNANTLAVRLSLVLLFFYCLFLPLYFVLNGIIKALLIISGQHESRREELKSRRDIRFVINLAGREVGLSADDQRVIEDIFDFRDQIASGVMVPFHQLPVIGINQPPAETAELSVESGHRFIAVSRGRTDNVVGYVDALDLIWFRGKSIEKLVKKPVFFPETRRITDLLLEMNQNNLEVVFLADEFGGVAGMITPGQIVGDLFPYIPEVTGRDEIISRSENGNYMVSGGTDLEDLSHELGIRLKKGQNSSIGGYLCERTGIIPEAGAQYSEGGFVFTIAERDDRQILRIDVRKET